MAGNMTNFDSNESHRIDTTLKKVLEEKYQQIYVADILDITEENNEISQKTGHQRRLSDKSSNSQKKDY